MKINEASLEHYSFNRSYSTSKDDLLNGRGPYKYYLKEIIDEAFSKKEVC